MVALFVKADNISKSYKGKPALVDANLELRGGEILGLLGPNGAGKTTLIKILATLLQKDKGYVEIMGYNLDKNENMIRHLIGYVGQDSERSAYARLTPLENLKFFGGLRGIPRKVLNQRINELTEIFEFTPNLNKQFMHLSGGQKQTMVIIRSLLHDPPILILDEPTKGLDPIVSKKIRKFLVNYVRENNKSMLLTSHILSEVENMADRVTLIDSGLTYVSGTPNQIIQNIGVKDFIEFNSDDLPLNIINEIEALDSVVQTSQPSSDSATISFGILDLYQGTKQILDVLEKNKVKVQFKHRSVTLEDAFIQLIGNNQKEVHQVA